MNWLTRLFTSKKQDASGPPASSQATAHQPPKPQTLPTRAQAGSEGGRIVFDTMATSAGSCSRCGKRIEPVVDPRTGGFRYFKGDRTLKSGF